MAFRRGFFARLALAGAATAGAVACGNLLGIEQAEHVDKPEPTHDAGGGGIIVTTTQDAGGTSPADAGNGRRGWVQVYFEVLKNDEAWSPNVRASKEAYQQPAASPPLPYKAAAYFEGALYGGNQHTFDETRVGACSVLETNEVGTFTDRPFFSLVEISSAISPAPLQLKSYQQAGNPVTVAVNDPSGQMVTFSASNGSVPGFGLRRLVVPRPITMTEPAMVTDAGSRAEIDRSEPMRVRWTGGTGGKVRATVYAMENVGNPVRRVEIYCDAAATAGAIDIPAEALGHLPKPNTAGMSMFFNVQLYSIDEFTSGDYDVTLNVLSPVNPIDTTPVTVTR